MHDPFPSIWADRIANLPPVKSLGFVIEPNRDAEELSCLICDSMDTDSVVDEPLARRSGGRRDRPTARDIGRQGLRRILHRDRHEV